MKVAVIITRMQNVMPDEGEVTTVLEEVAVNK
jgi:hypothetical protein